MLKLVGYLLPARLLEHHCIRHLVELLPVALLAGFAVGAVAVWQRAPFLVIVVLAAATTALLRLTL